LHGLLVTAAMLSLILLDVLNPGVHIYLLKKKILADRPYD
jgi:hypothetical protein